MSTGSLRDRGPVTDELVTPTTVYRLGRARTTHAWRVLIVDGQVAVHTRCGINLADHEDTTLHTGFITCPTCIEAAAE